MYFGLSSPHVQRTRFLSENTSTNSRHPRRHHRRINFLSQFAPDFHQDNIFINLVVFEGRRYLVGGTYDQALRRSNRSLRDIGIDRPFKGDIGVCFFDKIEPERFLKGVPHYTSMMERKRALRAVLQGYDLLNYILLNRLD